MPTIHQYGSSFKCSAAQAHSALAQFGRFPVTTRDVTDRNGEAFRVAVVWGIKAPQVRIIVEDI